MSQQEWNKRFPEENNKTLKKVIIALLTVAILAPGVFAWGLRVDVSSKDSNMKLTPVSIGGDNALRNIFWGIRRYAKAIYSINGKIFLTGKQQN